MPAANAAVNPLTVASPAQVHAILAEVSKMRPELTPFFACLYYAALRPEEAVALRNCDLVLPRRGWGKLILTRASPRTGSAWTSTGAPHEARGLKHRPGGAIRIIPIPPVLATLLRQHLQNYGTHPMGGCSAAPVAACSANRSTAAPGTPPGWLLWDRPWPPPDSPGGPTTCGTPPCRCGSTPPARPPRSPPAPGPASASCTPSIPTASTASKTW